MTDLPQGLRRVEVPAAVAARLDANFTILQSAQQQYRVAQVAFESGCCTALDYANETADAGIVGVENGPDVFAIIVRDAPLQQLPAPDPLPAP